MEITLTEIEQPTGLLGLLKKYLVEVVLPQTERERLTTAEIKNITESVVKIVKEIREQITLAGYGARAQKITELASRVIEARSGCTQDEIRALINEVSEAVEVDEVE